MVESAWRALRRHLSDFRSLDPGRNNPALGHVLGALDEATGESYAELDVLQLGWHTLRLRKFARRADELLIPELAAELDSLEENLGMFLAQLPEWQAYAARMATPLGSPEEEDEAVRRADAAIAAIEEAAPNAIAPETRRKLDALSSAAKSGPDEEDADVAPLLRRSFLHAVRDAIWEFAREAVSRSRAGVMAGIETFARSTTVAALTGAMTALMALAAGLPSEFGWLAWLIAHLRRLLRRDAESADKGGEER